MTLVSTFLQNRTLGAALCVIALGTVVVLCQIFYDFFKLGEAA